MRAKIILEAGTSRTFTPFDRFAQFSDSAEKSPDELLDELKSLRNENLELLKRMNIQAEDLRREGVHPELGAVTLEHLPATRVVHDLGHLRQIARVPAKNYKEEIGVWEKYLPVVNE